ncbi:Transcriptional regulatory protein ZraR [Poriferisphaera corsica]|uniref:Transcriptional regulatory protein ZraR n=2 Tax=Poriferisphaera corsica TaxID=2528020 RepID=A0A517YSH1_9BACT|nr:Transcriptional regulatory protein ZraR [Poriferisphaera corsica]
MSNKILVVDDKQMMRDSVGATLQRGGFTVVVASNGKVALDMVAKHRPAAVITDLKMPEMDGLALLKALKQADDQLPVVLMTAYGKINDAVAAMKEGAFDFIQKPFEGDQLVVVMKRAVKHRQLVQENTALKTASTMLENSPTMIGTSAGMRRVAQQIHQIANSSGTVLICGESGTGKEVVARTLHAHSARRNRLMLCLNCAALSSSLLESELFGHERGAFTGADQLRKGRFELSDGGTLLLDEISEISPQLQAKLLRVLQEGQFERVGSSLTMNVDVRVVATTNRDLAQSVMAGEFRQDLYYRLNVLPVYLPPLREREKDIPLLAEHFLNRVALREGKESKRFDDEAIGVLKSYAWPGNVRELQNICERASVLSRSQVIDAGLIQPWLMTPSMPVGGFYTPAPNAMNGGHVNGGGVQARGGHGGVPPQMGGYNGAVVNGAGVGQAAVQPQAMTNVQEVPMAHSSAGNTGGLTPEVRSLEEIEREQIIKTLGHFGGNRQQTAEALGIGVRTLGLKLKKWKELNLVAQTI